MVHQYTYPEMQFLEELGFVPDISRAGKFGRFREEYTAGSILGGGGYLSVYLYPNFDRSTKDGAGALAAENLAIAMPNVAASYGLGAWDAPDSLPRSESVDLNIWGSSPTGLPEEKYDGLTVVEAVEKARQYVETHKVEIGKLSKK